MSKVPEFTRELILTAMLLVSAGWSLNRMAGCVESGAMNGRCPSRMERTP